MSKFPILIDTPASLSLAYKNCRILNYHRYSDHPSVRRAIKALCEEMRYKGTVAELQSKVLALDLYHCYKGDKTRYLKFYLSPNSYESIQKYNWFNISYWPVRKITEHLERLEYIEVKKGFRDKKTGHTEASKMRATSKLIYFLENEHGVKPAMVSTWRNEELIILKGETKKVMVNGRWKKLKPKISYVDTKATNAMRKVLVDYNKLLTETWIDIDTTGYTYVRKIKERYRDAQNRHLPLRIDLSNKKVKRVFNNESFKQGGRFYNGFWQGCPESLRQHIMLDGEHVYEYDFSGMHVHLLYSLVGLMLGDKEPYILPKNDEHGNMRRVYKLIMLTSVNCKSDKECIVAVMDQLTDDMEQEPDKYPSVIPDLEAMLKELRKHHAPITRFINSSTGLPLQYIDSSIAEHVIIRMTAKSIPVLCIHDSFICKVSNASIVHQAMKTAFIEIVTMNLKDTNYVLKISAEEVFTSECNESQVKFPAYRRLNNSYNILSFALVFNNGYARRKLHVLATGVKEFNEVITPNMRVEYY